MALVAGLAIGCKRSQESSQAPADSLRPDTLSAAEQESFHPNPQRYPEMQEGRLDSVDLIGRASDAAWHVQDVNYAPKYVAMTYAAWYTGPRDAVRFAADGQPYLKDENGHVYEGILVPSNPRVEVASGTTAVGSFVFMPGLEQDADSLTLFVNDSTAPVIRIGPWAVPADAPRGAVPGTGPNAVTGPPRPTTRHPDTTRAGRP